jgi:two-component system chemotaxis response regulator CheB
VKRDIVAIGASAGGLPAILELVSGLPHDFPGTLFVVIHTSPESPNRLPEILARSSNLPAIPARNGDPIRKGVIYAAVPDHHLFVQGGRVCSVRGPKENGFRPGIDPLFRSVAREFGPRVAGVVMSGARDDGAYGLDLIKRAGGLALVQDPDESLFPSMPLSALAATSVDHVLPARRIAAALFQAATNSDNVRVGELRTAGGRSRPAGGPDPDGAVNQARNREEPALPASQATVPPRTSHRVKRIR